MRTSIRALLADEQPALRVLCNAAMVAMTAGLIVAIAAICWMR